MHGPSVVVDPHAYRWRHPEWQGRPWEETVLYELHPGLLGGFNGIEAKLPELKSLDITAIELMPIAEFPGARNWGYDGVLPFAPERGYGTPDELKHLIDAAHAEGMMVFLDVVYNHFGPDGNYLGLYAPQFFRDDIPTPWGPSIDFRRPEVRRFFTENALYWLMEYRFDGLRFDAVHAIPDAGWLDEMAAEIRATVEPGRHVHLVLEHDGNVAEHLRRDFDAQWNDDIHHVLHHLLTGEASGYYEDYATDPAEKLARALSQGFIYQGEPSPYRDGERRGTPSGDLPPSAFVSFLQNHDQIGNRPFGERLTALADPEALEAAIALQLLSPHIPLIFMGEEDASDAPFFYFTDHHGELAETVREGRRREFAKFPGFSDPARREEIPDPNAPETFARSLPEPDARHGQSRRALYRRLLDIRRREIVPRLSTAQKRRREGGRTVCRARRMALRRRSLAHHRNQFRSRRRAGRGPPRRSFVREPKRRGREGKCRRASRTNDASLYGAIFVSERDLRELAKRAGLLSDWIDADGGQQRVSNGSLEAVLEALGFPCGTEAELAESKARLDEETSETLPPLITAIAGAPISLSLKPKAAKAEIRFESGPEETRALHPAGEGRVTLGPVDEPGYHRLIIDGRETTIAVAPPRCVTFGDIAPGEKMWGLSVQLYGLRREGDFGIGDAGALAEFAAAAAREGADAVAISPAHSLFPADPARFAPYSPSSRLFLNPLHADPATAFPADRMAAAQQSAPPAKDATLIDWDAAGRKKYAALHSLYEEFARDELSGDADNALARDFHVFIRDGGDYLFQHAIFEAAQKKWLADDPPRWSWSDWPAEWRDPNSETLKRFAAEHVARHSIFSLPAMDRRSLFLGGASLRAQRRHAHRHHHRSGGRHGPRRKSRLVAPRRCAVKSQHRRAAGQDQRPGPELGPDGLFPAGACPHRL